MALSEIYVDPSIAADSGTGTIGDPFGDLEYAIEQTTFDTTNGTRVNVRSSATETLAANLATALADAVTTVAWVPSETAPLVFQGYTTAAGDGGIGVISGGGSVPVFSDVNQDYVTFADLRLTNCGANYIVDVDNYCTFYNVEIDTCSGTAGLSFDTGCLVSKVYVHDCSGTYGIVSGGSSYISECFVVTDGATYGIGHFNSNVVSRCIVVCNNIGDSGIFLNSEGAWTVGNSIYSSVANTAVGIKGQTGKLNGNVLNNLVEGFSGAGGVGIDFGDANTNIMLYGGNAVYNCTTEYNAPTFACVDLGDNETLTASPFTDAANNDFSPVDTGNVKEGSLPQAFPGP